MAIITILVSVYNKVETIEKCIKSLLALNYPDKDILVIDGYSSDGSFEILQKFGDKINLCRVKGNYSKALNWALDRINTKYTALTDADCVVEKDWVDELLKGFEGADIIATAGYCGTATDVTNLQKAIGLEMDSRFQRFPSYISRAPTMNLCFKTDAAKQTRFDENIEVGIETDFGYRLTKLGKMKYMPKAKVWHYHRANIFSYFKQKRSQAEGAVKTYLRHREKISGDHISTPLMMIQIPLAVMIFAGIFLGIWNNIFLYSSWTAFSFLIILYLYNLFIITRQIKYYPYLLLIFITRTLAWTAGSLIGTVKLLVRT